MGGMVEGQFDDHFANGFCHLNFENGDKYKGNLQNGEIHGKGIKYTASTNSWVYQAYEHGEPVHDIYKGDGEPINIGLISSQLISNTFICNSEINIETDGLTVSNMKMVQDINNKETYEV